MHGFAISGWISLTKSYSWLFVHVLNPIASTTHESNSADVGEISVNIATLVCGFGVAYISLSGQLPLLWFGGTDIPGHCQNKLS